MVAGRKSAVYREVNLTTAALLAEYGSDDAAHFLCECDDESCSRRLELRRDEFEAGRAAGGRLVSFECVRGAEVLHRGDRYAAVAD
jgi:hypothetical protein